MRFDEAGLRDALAAFADLAGDAVPSQAVDVSSNGDPIAWLGATAWHPFGARPAVVFAPSDELSRLAAIDALAPSVRLLRLGWLWLVGTLPPDAPGGGGRTVLTPLWSLPVRIIRLGVPVPAGDPEVSPLVTDPAVRAALGRRAPQSTSALLQWCADASHAASLPATDLFEASVDPAELRGRPGVAVWRGAAIFTQRRPVGLDLSGVLRAWSGRVGVEATALGAVYGVGHPPPPAGEPSLGEDRAGPSAPVRSPLLLDPEQQAVVRSARANPVTLVSGAPGTGKSHTVVATAIDAVARGCSVLVATQSEHASLVLSDLLRRHPGPTPVLFGSQERRDDVAAELSSGLGVPLSAAEDTARRSAVEAAAARVAWVERAITLVLRRERVAGAAPTRDELVAGLLAVAPGAFDGEVDLDRARRLLDELEGPAEGWLDRRRHRKVAAELAALLRTEGSPALAELALAVDVASARRAQLELDGLGGSTVGGLWDDLGRADEELRAAVGALAADRARGAAALDLPARRAVAALATALRSGRERRRQVLEEVDGGRLLRALPLWIGTLRDIEEILPPTPAAFDLVILDEASQIDQMHAVSALARARRAVVVGDPRQLRHVSFASDEAVALALAEHGLAHVGGLLDVRRNSIFDAAAASHPVHELVDEHRAAPQIRFPIERFYGHELQLATRHPRNDRRDCIEVVRVEGRRGDDKVNRAEVAEVLSQLDALGGSGRSSVGVISPFRAQVDAITEAVLDRWGPDDIDALGLRIGTVHEFQGAERDVVVLSLVLGDDAPASSRRFLEDPHLFDVMITRAREQLIVVTSMVTPPPGLTADWLAQADRPPTPPPDGDPGSRWAEEIATHLVELGVPVRRGYPVGRWTVDLCVGDERAAVAVECVPHPDGARAHVDRHRALRQAGWRVVDAFPTRFGGRAAEAAISVAAELR